MSKKIYIQNKRLNFSYLEEFIFRVLVVAFYAFLISATIILLISQNKRLIALGLLLCLFLIDRLIHLNQGRKTVWEIQKNGGNLSDALTPSALKILLNSLREAKFNNNFDLQFALLNNLLNQDEIKIIFKRLNVAIEDFENKLKTFAKINKQEINKKEFFNKILFAAFQNALLSNDPFIYPRNLLAAILNTDGWGVEKVFNFFNIKRTDLDLAVVFGKWKQSIGKLNFLPEALGGFVVKHRIRHRIMNRAWTARPTPLLDEYGEDLTDLARESKIGFLVGHQSEFESLINILSRPHSPNALLVGEAGIGKETIVQHLAYKIIKDEVPPPLFDKRLVFLNFSSLLSSAAYEELAYRINEISSEIENAENIILFIPNIHDLFKKIAGGEMNAIDLFLPLIKNYKIPVIGDTYPLEFKEYIEKNSDFLEQFEIIRVQEITEEESVQILIYQSILWEKKYKVFIPFVVLRRAVYLAKRYLHNKPLPGSALSLLEEVVGKAFKDKKREITLNDLDNLVEQKVQIPIQKAEENEAQKLLELEKLIHQKFINQNEAVSAVSNALREYRSGLSRKGGPIATFLFVGPTGVGKTELSKILAEIQFGSKDAMVRFDMSEYQETSSIYKLIGHPDGKSYGILTNAILEHPYSLILLDEFEKAHPDILNIFLQVFDDGRLTDSFGKVVDFQNTIIIATSNVDSAFIKEQIEKGKDFALISEEVKKRLSNYFKPELLNRFSDVVIFKDLNQEEIKMVAGLLMEDLQKTLEEEQDINLSYDDEVLKLLAKKGYDPAFGARPLRKVIANEVKTFLAQNILSGKIKRGDSIKITVSNGKIEFMQTKD
jgi:ATP-dependent Clp protease ATP-binding subunit ClpC